MKSIFFTAITALILFGHQSYAQTDVSNSNKTTKMKQFSLLVRVPLNYTTEQVKSTGPKWDALLDKWKAEGIYITSFAFPGESHVVTGLGKFVTKGAVVADNRRVVSNLFLRAETIETAIELAKECPVLEFDGSVEVREIPERPVR